MRTERFKPFYTPCGIHISDCTEECEIEGEYSVYALKLHGKYLGYIYWSEVDDQYGFFPDDDIVLVGDVLKDVFTFIDILMADRVLN